MKQVMGKIFFFLTAAALFISVIQGTAAAGGGASYPNGAEGFLNGAIPPPGFYYLNYSYYYSADTMKDNNGDDVPAFDDISILANVSRFIWMTEKNLLGGNYGQHLFIPYLNVNLDFNGPVGPQSRRNYSDSDLPFLIYSPLVLAYHLQEGKLHIALSAVDLYIPTGQEDGNLAGVGRNFWTFEPVVALTYMFNDKWAVSGKFMYDFNTKQKDYPTNYGFEVDRTPGQEFHVDYSLSYALKKGLRIGLNGYYYTQTTDDDYDLDSTIPAQVRSMLKEDEGEHSRVFAAGPGIRYNYKNMFFSLRSQFEMAAKNKTEGDNIWFKFTYAF
ncbi:MAG: transporter [Desulfurivibrionaceae bacterium]